TLANFIREQVTGAIQGAMAPHQPALASARQQQEYTAVQAAHGSDPDYQRKAAVATKLIQGNPNISFQQTYDLVDSIHQSFGASGPHQTGPAVASGGSKCQYADYDFDAGTSRRKSGSGRASSPAHRR